MSSELLKSSYCIVSSWFVLKRLKKLIEIDYNEIDKDSHLKELRKNFPNILVVVKIN